MKKDINVVFSGLKRSFSVGFYKKDISSESISTDDEESHRINETERNKSLHDRRTFLLYAIGYSLGLGNVWRFPHSVYTYGQGTFLIVYSVLCFSLGIPLLILEFSIGQFSGRGCTHVFRMVPLFIGLGWSMLLLSVLVTVYYSVTISYAYFYAFSIFGTSLPWSHCNNDFNSFSCVSSYMRNAYPNESGVTSAKEYFEYYIIRSRNLEHFSSEHLPNPLLTFSLAAVYLVPVLRNMFGRKVSSRILHFTVLYPYFIILFLICRGFNLKGGLKGIKYFLKPEMSMNILKVCFKALEQVVFSLGLGVGVMITLSSYNNFYNNIINDVICIVLIDYLTCVVFGLAVFSALGHLSNKLEVSMRDVVQYEWELYYVAYPTMLADLYGEAFWNFVFVFMFVCLGFDAQLGFLEAITRGIFESFTSYRKTFAKKIILEIVISIVLFCFSLILLMPGGPHWLFFLSARIIKVSLFVFIFLEVGVVVYLYGYRLYVKDCLMMVKSIQFKIWAVVLTFLIPVVLFASLIFDIKKYSSRLAANEPLGWLTNLIIIFLVIILLCPIILGMVKTLLNCQLYFPNSTKKELILATLKPTPDWGPYLKKDWLSSTRYRNNLLSAFENPMFRSNIRENENIDEIMGILQKHKG